MLDNKQEEKVFEIKLPEELNLKDIRNVLSFLESIGLQIMKHDDVNGGHFFLNTNSLIKIFRSGSFLGFFAKNANLSEDQVKEWLISSHEIRCTAITKSGNRCKNEKWGGCDVNLWHEGREWKCKTHEGTEL